MPTSFFKNEVDQRMLEKHIAQARFHVATSRSAAANREMRNRANKHDSDATEDNSPDNCDVRPSIMLKGIAKIAQD